MDRTEMRESPGQNLMLLKPSEKRRRSSLFGVEETPGRCGLGRCAPRWLQPFASLWVFIVVFFFYNFIHGLQGSYTISVLTTLEKRFNMPSSQSGILATASTIGYSVCSIFVTHFLKNTHFPRVLSISALMAGLAALLYVIPHFLYGTGNPDVEVLEAQAANFTMPSFTMLSHFCSNDASLVNITEGASAAATTGAPDRSSVTRVAFTMFVLAEVIHGVAGTAIWGLGMVFIDVYVPKETSSKLLGLMFSIRFLSPLVGFAMGAAFLAIYASLKETSMTMFHPRWIGAWWLGYFVVSACCLLSFVILSMTPKRMRGMKDQDKLAKEQERKEQREAKLLTDAKSEGRRKSSWWEKTETSDEDLNLLTAKVHDVKDLPKALCRLFLNPVYCILTFGAVTEVLVIGYFIFLPKYIEVQFQKTPLEANLWGGVGFAVCGGVASLLSGAIAAKVKDKGVPGTTLVCLIVASISTLAFLVLFAFGCEQLPVAGSLGDGGLDSSLQCNANCSCSPLKYEPVCGDGQIYYSACHAGCRAAPPNSTYLEDCACVHSGETTGGLCGSGCDNQLLLFIVACYVVSILLNLYNVPFFSTLIDCVDKEDKSLAVGLAMSVFGLLVFPAPILYGRAIDMTCIVPMPGAGAGGACLLYDRRKLKIYLHTLTMVIKVVSLIFYGAAWLVARKRFKMVGKPRSLKEMADGPGHQLIGKKLADHSDQDKVSVHHEA